MLSELIVRFLPIVILLFLGFSVFLKKKLLSFPYYLSMFVCIIVVLAITMLPLDFSIDKPRYVSLFHNRYLYGALDEYKDMGWMFYVTFCAKVFRNNVNLFFFLTAFVYVFSYYWFGKHFFEKKSFYFVIMAMGCLGFIAYATNTIRAGFGIAFILFGFIAEKKAWRFLWLFLSITFHRSMIIPVAGFFFAGFVEKKWVYYLGWIACLVLSLANVDLGPLFETFGFVDVRVETYAQSIEKQFSSYKKGFRWDFLLYSVIPLIIYAYETLKHKIRDITLDRIVNTYLFANAIWLLVIRMDYSDRMAYLSWFLIPFITLYPVIKYQEKYKDPNGLIIGIMWVFMGLDIILMLL